MKQIFSIIALLLSIAINAQNTNVEKPLLLVDGAIAWSKGSSIDPSQIEAIHVYKDASAIPEEISDLKGFLNKGIISVALKKPLEADTKITFENLLKVNALESGTPILLNGQEITDMKREIYASAIFTSALNAETGRFEIVTSEEPIHSKGIILTNSKESEQLK